jgi:hypothetical protein
MSNTPEFIEVILIDDEKGYCDSLKSNARTFGIKITDFQNLEEGLEALKQNNKYKGLILDAKCLLDHEQEKEDDGFLLVALQKIRDIEKELDRHIPFVVNTGYLENYNSYKKGLEQSNSKLFSKTENKSEMFNFLKGEISRAEDTKIVNNHKKLFSIFEKGYLTETNRKELLALLKSINAVTQPEIKKNLGLIRTLLEAIYYKLNRIDKNIVPDTCIRQNEINCREVTRFLNGYPNKENNYIITSKFGFTKTHRTLSDNLYSITSDHGSHHYSEPYAPTNYLVLSSTYQLLELLIWFKNVMDSKS